MAEQNNVHSTITTKNTTSSLTVTSNHARHNTNNVASLDKSSDLPIAPTSTETGRHTRPSVMTDIGNATASTSKQPQSCINENDADLFLLETELLNTNETGKKSSNKKKKKTLRNKRDLALGTESSSTTSTANESTELRESSRQAHYLSIGTQTTNSRSASLERPATSTSSNYRSSTANDPTTFSQHSHRHYNLDNSPGPTQGAKTRDNNKKKTPRHHETTNGNSASGSTRFTSNESATQHNNAITNQSTSSNYINEPRTNNGNNTNTSTSASSFGRSRGSSQSTGLSNYGRVNVILPPPLEPADLHHETQTNNRVDEGIRHRNQRNQRSSLNDGNSNSNSINNANTNIDYNNYDTNGSDSRSSRHHSYNGHRNVSFDERDTNIGNSHFTEEGSRRNQHYSRRLESSNNNHDRGLPSTTSIGTSTIAATTTTTTTATSVVVTSVSTSAAVASTSTTLPSSTPTMPLRTVPRGRAPLPPPLPEPVVTVNPTVSTSSSSSPSSPSPAIVPPDHDDSLPLNIEAQRDAFRRLQEELFEIQRTNRRLLQENIYLHQVNEQLESMQAELSKMACEQQVRLEAAGQETESETPSVPTEWRCRICYEQPISHVIIPCGHAVTCEKCALTLNEHCCVCRRAITQIIRLYFG
ncbi:hypothetical protein BDF19DRAFT_143213 [Syncephalis fuscata]|nr:hypothetical protein BDF19DRAFT_143213 [Syncephalis fuscata]